MSADPVSVRLFAGAAEAYGSPEARLDRVANLGELIDALAAGGDDRVREVLEQCSFFVAGERFSALDTPVPPGSRVDVLPPFAGG